MGQISPNHENTYSFTNLSGKSLEKYSRNKTTPFKANIIMKYCCMTKKTCTRQLFPNPEA